MKKSFIILVPLCCLFLMDIHAQGIVLELVFDGILTSDANPIADENARNFYSRDQHPQSVEAPYLVGIKDGGYFCTETDSAVIYADWDGDGIEERHTWCENKLDSIFLYSKLDFTLYKSFRLNELSWLSSVAKGIYTSDKNLTCFVASCLDDGRKGGYRSGVYDENGTKVATLDIGAAIAKTEIVQIGDGYKLLVKCEDNKTYVFALGGNISEETTINNIPAKQFARPYPNPTNGSINLPYELNSKFGHMRIFDAGGHLVETRLISNQQETLELNTQAYPAGLYFYEVEGMSQSFIVKK